MADHVECLVVGGGAVGLGIGRAFANTGHDVVVLEANPWIGGETSSRNNEVIHAGFVYRPDSLRAALCPKACIDLYAYCAKHGITTANTGKLIFVTDEEDVGLLERLKGFGEANGVGGIALIGGKAASALEPQLHCHAALFSEKSGIVDGHGLMLAYRGEIESSGGAVALNAVARRGSRTVNGYEINIEIGGTERYALSCDILINAAGLGAEAFAAGLDFYPEARVPKVYYGKGSFFSYSGPPPFSRHISPLGSTLEMGGTYTVDLGGRAKFGPDFELVAEKDYDVDPTRRARFAEAIRRYFPHLEEDRLQPDYAGNRPMLSAHRDVQLDDWMIDGPATHGFPGLVHLFGISTPGLTSSIVLGDYVRSLL